MLSAIGEAFSCAKKGKRGKNFPSDVLRAEGEDLDLNGLAVGRAVLSRPEKRAAGFE